MNQKRVPLAKITALLATAFLSLALGLSGTAQQNEPAREIVVNDSLTKERDAKVLNLFESNCAKCHGGAHPKMRLSLESARLPASVKDVPSRQVDSLKLVDTGRPGMSYLLMKLRGDKGIRGARMPDDAPPLAADEIRAIELWARGLAAPGPARMPARADTGHAGRE